MKSVFRILVVLLGIGSLGGCLSMNSYVPPEFRHASYHSIKQRATPYKFKLVTQFQTNGKPNSGATALLTKNTNRVIQSSGFCRVVPDEQSSDGTLSLTMNNVADIGEGFAKGFGTGLTFGMAGSLVTDYYEFDANLRMKGGRTMNKHYKHAIHTTVGNKKGPDGMQPMGLSAAVDQIMEDLVLNTLKDAQENLPD